MIVSYNRSEILSYFDLSPRHKSSLEDNDSAREDSYVICDDEVLPLSMFLHTNSTFWDGIYSTSIWSAYFIKISKCGTKAVVANRHF